MRIVHWLCETRTGRVVVRVGRRTRLAPTTTWSIVPEAPHEVAGAVPTPLLVVHGDADSYFPIEHVELLQDAAPRGEFWIEPGMGHAEAATTPELVARIADWVKVAVSSSVRGEA
jgi:pimeloyl-ACP methyl ester carboxylesterase